MTPRARARTGGAALALLGAFPFPYPQGSQIFMADQARALARAGADPTLFTYGRGLGPLPNDLAVTPAPRWASPRAMRSGPQLGKPFADATLWATYVRSARTRFGFALAHNAEAALIALSARSITRVPVVYVAHTILQHELSAYASPRWGPQLDRLGDGIDHLIARQADGVIALCDEAADTLRASARGPVAVIPPGRDPGEAPTPQRVTQSCARHGLRENAFFLYAGNLDAYQDLELLAAAARRLPADAPPIVIATHDATRVPRALEVNRARPRIVTVDDFEEVRALCVAARALILTRRRPGGFPVKLLNYMEAERPIVAFERVAAGLVDGRSARLLAPDADADDLAEALVALHGDDALRERLGAGARRHLLDQHGWDAIASRTLDFLGSLRDLGRLGDLRRLGDPGSLSDPRSLSDLQSPGDQPLH